MTRGQLHATQELAKALSQPCEKNMVSPSQLQTLGIDAAACEFHEDDDGSIDITCHEVLLGLACERFVYYDAAMAYLQALGESDET